jgi:hypothetical protein
MYSQQYNNSTMSTNSAEERRREHIARNRQLINNNYTDSNRPIGAKAKLNGRDVYWSGAQYKWQSLGSHNKLKQQGHFNPAPLGSRVIDGIVRDVQRLAASPVGQRIAKAQQQFVQVTDRVPGIKQLDAAARAGLNAEDKLPSSRVAQGAGILAQQVADKANVDPRLAAALVPLLVGRVSVGSADDAARAASRTYKPGEAVGVRWYDTGSGRKGNAFGFQETRPTRGTPAADTQARVRSTSVEHSQPRPPQGKRGGTRSVPNQTSQTGATTTARVSSGGYKPSGGKAPHVDAKGNYINNVATPQTSPNGHVRTDLRGTYDTDGTKRIQAVVGRDARGNPIVSDLQIPVINSDDKAIRGPIGQYTGPVGDDFVRGEPTGRQQRARNRALNSGRNQKGDVAQANVGDEMARTRRALDRTGSRVTPIEPEPSYENGSRIIYQGGSANVTRQNQFDPDNSRARYQGRDQSPSTSPKAAMYESDDVFDADGFNDWDEFNPGFSETKRRGQRGSSGASSRSVSGEVRQQIIDGYQSTEAGGAIYETVRRRRPDGSRYREKTLSQRGTRQPSDDYMNERIQREIGEHRAATDAATGRRSPDSISPGNRFRGNAERLSEPQKLLPQPHISTYGGSMPPGPKAKDKGAVREYSVGPERVQQNLDIRQARAEARGQRGPLRNDNGKTMHEILVERRKNTKPGSRERAAIDAALENTYDTQLRADSRTRNAGVRTDKEYNVQADTRHVMVGRNNTRIEGRNSRPVRGESDYLPKTEPKPEKDRTVGTRSPNQRNRVTPADPSIVRHDASVPAQRYADRQRERRRAERQGRPAEYQPTEAEAQEALKELRLQERHRSGPIDAGRQEQIRLHNEAIRQDPRTARQREFRGVELEPEIVRNPAPQFPNIAPPTDTNRWKSETYGDVGPNGFKTKGELKGVKTVGRVKDKGRSKKAERRAERLIERSRNRKAEGKSPRVQRTYKRAGTKKDGTTFKAGDPKPASKTQREKDAQMEAIRRRRAERRQGRP